MEFYYVFESSGLVILTEIIGRFLGFPEESSKSKDEAKMSRLVYGRSKPKSSYLFKDILLKNVLMKNCKYFKVLFVDLLFTDGESPLIFDY